MLFNKNQVRKTDDKKVLRKVGKNWKVVSIALLMAIGGTAVATNAHANAATETANEPVVNNNENNNVAQQVKSLEAAPNMQGQTKPASANSSTNSSAKKSVAPSSVSYVSGDNGSAASYHNAANTENSVASDKSAVVSGYINSLNNRFPSKTADLNNALNTNLNKENNDNTNAKSASAISHDKNFGSNVNSLAAKANLPVDVYVASLEDTRNNLNNNVSNAKSNVNQLKKVASAKSLINDARVNHAKYYYNALIADAKANVADQLLSGAQNIYDGLNSASANYQNASLSHQLEYMKESTANQVALIESGDDASAVQSLASQFGYKNNSAAVSNEVKAYANAKDSADNAYTFTTNSLTRSTVNQANEVAVIRRIVSNADAVSDFANFANTSLNASAVSPLTMKSAESAVASASSKDVIADSEAAKAENLANVGTENDTEAVNNTLGITTSHYVPQALRQASASLASHPINQGTINSLNSYLVSGNYSGFVSAEISAEGLNSNEANAIVNAESNDVNYNPEAANGSRTITTGKDANDVNTLDAYANLTDAQVNALLNSDNSALNSAEVSSADYAKANDNYYALNNILAASYSNNASSDAKKVASASNALENFYNANVADGAYANAKNAYDTAVKNANDDSKLASAYGMHVYNYGPKYITVNKKLALYNGLHQPAKKLNSNVPVGTTLQVLGVGFAENGLTRYVVNYNGQQGVITANPNYAANTYLPATKNEVRFTTTKNTYAYNNGKRTAAIKAGTTLTGYVVAQPDSNYNNGLVYGAFSRIQLADNKANNGDLVTANTKYVQLNNAQPAKKSTNDNNNNNKPSVINFFD